jgi:hypothetical protein
MRARREDPRARLPALAQEFRQLAHFGPEQPIAYLGLPRRFELDVFLIGHGVIGRNPRME